MAYDIHQVREQTMRISTSPFALHTNLDVMKRNCIAIPYHLRVQRQNASYFFHKSAWFAPLFRHATSSVPSCLPEPLNYLLQCLSRVRQVDRCAESRVMQWCLYIEAFGRSSVLIISNSYAIWCNRRKFNVYGPGWRWIHKGCTMYF